MRANEFEKSFKILFHTSKASNRSSILKTGLEPRNQEYENIKRLPGIYMFESLAQAKEWAYWSAFTELEPIDIWKIQVPKTYKLVRDKHSEMNIYNAVIGYDTISPNILTLVKTQRVEKSSKNAPKIAPLIKSDIVEGLNYPIICVDVQPEYCDATTSQICSDIIHFVNKQTGPVLMFVNAEQDGLTRDTISSIKQFWEEIAADNRSELDEIKIIHPRPEMFPIETARERLNQATKMNKTIDGFQVYKLNNKNVHMIILADNNNEPAALAGFVERINDLWQVANAVTFNPYKGKALVAKIYQMVMKDFGKNIQSDVEQGTEGARLWTKTLPSLGFKPMIYDSTSGYIIDPANTDTNVYHNERYTWIIQRDNYYNLDRDLLKENNILMPLRAFWHDHPITEEELTPIINWNRFTIVDKGYGFFRSYMDSDVEPRLIIKLIRYMYQKNVYDSREIVWPSFSKRTPDESELMHLVQEFEDDLFIINWTSISQLKRFNGAYIVGGGRNECLREVELLMNAFNIKYKRIDRLVY